LFVKPSNNVADGIAVERAVKIFAHIADMWSRDHVIELSERVFGRKWLDCWLKVARSVIIQLLGLGAGYAGWLQRALVTSCIWKARSKA
jgi:hypothetical protein